MEQTRKGQPRGKSYIWGPRRVQLLAMYEDMGWSQKRIADHYGVDQSLISAVFRRLHIQAKPKWRCGPENGRYIDGSEARGYRKLVVKTKCATCGGTKDLGIHHKNDDHYDNRPINLTVLCNSCHMRHTKKKWWDAKKAGHHPSRSNAPIRWGRGAKSANRPKTGRGVLTTEEVREIRRQRYDGMSIHKIAVAHGVAGATIHAIVTGRSWKSV